jgi:hypothetical protein
MGFGLFGARVNVADCIGSASDDYQPIYQPSMHAWVGSDDVFYLLVFRYPLSA